LAICDKLLSTREDMSISIESQINEIPALTHLKTLHFIYSNYRLTSSFIIAVLKECPNLEKIYGLPLQLIQEIQESNHSSNNNNCVNLNGRLASVFISRNLYNVLELESRDFAADLTSLSQVKNPILEEISTLSFFVADAPTRKTCIETLSKIIKLNEKTLQKMAMEPLSSRLGSLSIPILLNLTTLEFDLKLNLSADSSFFPPSSILNLIQTFPRLSTVEIFLDEKSAQSRMNKEKAFREHFPPQTYTPSSFGNVSSLTLTNFAPVLIIKSIHQLFKNVKILRICHNIKNIAEILPSVFHYWPKLHQLILEVEFDARFGNLDSALTGMTSEECMNTLSSLSVSPHGKTQDFKLNPTGNLPCLT
jgi:hypothetical protein